MEVFVSRNGLDNGWRAYQPKSGDSDGEIGSHSGCKNNDEFAYSGSRTTWPDDEERPRQPQCAQSASQHTCCTTPGVLVHLFGE